MGCMAGLLLAAASAAAPVQEPVEEHWRVFVLESVSEGSHAAASDQMVAPAMLTKPCPTPRSHANPRARDSKQSGRAAYVNSRSGG